MPKKILYLAASAAVAGGLWLGHTVQASNPGPTTAPDGTPIQARSLGGPITMTVRNPVTGQLRTIHVTPHADTVSTDGNGVGHENVYLNDQDIKNGLAKAGG